MTWPRSSEMDSSYTQEPEVRIQPPESSVSWRDGPTAEEHPTDSGPNKRKAISRKVKVKMKLLSGLRSYIQSSPVPPRIVLLAALLLSSLYVFTSFIARTQLGTHLANFDWWRQAPIPFLNFFTWALLLPLVNKWVKQRPINSRPVWKPVLFHIALGLMLSSFHEVVTNTLYVLVLTYGGRMAWHPDMLNNILLSLPPGVVQRFMEYWLLLVVLMYIESHRQIRAQRTRVLQLQNELQTTQLLALKKQLQPHFLYNTLNTVSALMDVDNKSARKVLSRLGQLLRMTLDEERHETVSLIHEVDHVGNYLDIETIRFQDRLRVEYDIPYDCQDAQVPSMMLQPLVENSIKHGLDATSDSVRITISAERMNGSIKVEVSDDGRGCDDPAKVMRKGGIGLRNVRDRISLLHGEAGKFMVESKKGDGFRVSVILPYATERRPLNDERHTHLSGG